LTNSEQIITVMCTQLIATCFLGPMCDIVMLKIDYNVEKKIAE